MSPVRKSVLLACSRERAFVLFTEHASEWWPPERRHLGDPGSDIRIEASGRFYERARDGREAELGRVRDFEPPARLLLDFYVATGPDRPTEVEITFAIEDAGTRVTVDHRATLASAEVFPGRAAAYERSWEQLFARLAERACNG